MRTTETNVTCNPYLKKRHFVHRLRAQTNLFSRGGKSFSVGAKIV